MGSMMRLITTAIFVLFCLEVSAYAKSAELKGLEVISTELSARIARAGNRIDLADYLPGDGLNELMGSWEAHGSEHQFRNGLPSPLNMVLYNAVMSELAENIGASCEEAQLDFNETFLQILQDLCSWPASTASNDVVLQQFWIAVMGYGAPEAEFWEWRSFVLRPETRSLPAAEVVESMTLAITLNPYFLLQQ
jgi:hypothetical protein